MRVLIIKTSSLGDVIHTLPAITDATAQSNIRFDWVVEESFAEVPAWHPAVERVIPVALRRLRKSPFRTWRSEEWRQFKRQMRLAKYDAVIDAQGLLKSAWLTRYTEGPRYGLDKNSAREPLASRFYDHPIAVSKELHAVERVRRLFAAALNYQIPDGSVDYHIDKERLAATSYSDGYLVFLHGTTWPTKHWPQEYWAKLAGLAADAGLKALIPWGNDREKARAEYIAQSSSTAEVLPRLNLNELASVLAGARAVVSVDTGLAHLCAALDTPNLTLYGPTQPSLVGTYGAGQVHLQASTVEPEQLPESSSDKEPMSKLSAELVWRKLTAITEQSGA